MLKKFSLMMLIASIFVSAFAGTNTQVGRYLVEKNGAMIPQINPLQSTFQLTFPATVRTVGNAMSYLLSNTGYQIVPHKHQSQEVRDLLKQRLPLSDRQMGVMTVQQGLLALAGNTYQMLVDPQHRFISFQLRRQYEQLYSYQN